MLHTEKDDAATAASGDQPFAKAFAGDAGNTNSGRARGVNNLHSNHRRPMNRSGAGDLVNKFYQEIQKLAVDERLTDDFHFLMLDSNVKKTALSAVLIASGKEFNGKLHVSVQTLIIEGSGGHLNPRTINIHGTPVEILSVAGDVYDSGLMSRVVEVITESLGAAAIVHDAGAVVIPRELEPTDRDHLRRVLFHATNAVFTVLDESTGSNDVPFTADDISSQDQLTAHLDYSPAPVTNAVGLPIRSDLLISLRGSTNNGNQMSLHEQQQDLTRVDGFLDLSYAPPPPLTPGQAPVTQRYWPRFVITQLDSQTNFMTMETLLLGLATTGLLQRGGAWAGMLKPRYTNDLDLRDFGAVGYEVNLTNDPNAVPDRINIKSDNFSLRDQHDLIGATVHQSLIYSIDVEETGELSWLQLALVAAAEGNAAAANTIINSANALTKGQFLTVFPGGPVVVNENCRIHLGYYLNRDQQKSDIRDCDYLAVLNLQGKDEVIIKDWSDTFDQVNVPLEIRLEKRGRMISNLFPTAVFKGYARRITFTPQFIEALVIACDRAGLSIGSQNLFQYIDGYAQRGNPNIGQYAVGNINSGLFNPATGVGGGYNRGINVMNPWNQRK